MAADPHREIPVKVTAWVDEGVAPLVVALNELPDVMTLDSCQGDKDRDAHVFFCCRGDGCEAATFVAELGAILAAHGDAANYLLSAEWRPGNDEPIFRLACPAAHVNELASVVSGAFAPAHGRRGTALRS